MQRKRAMKPDFDRLSCSVQVKLRPNEYKNADRIRRETGFATMASWGRMVFLKAIGSKIQTEMFPNK